MMDELKEQALKKANCIFPCEEKYLNAFDIEKAISKFPKAISQTKPFFIRLSGQSGSGKSSQLLPGIQTALKQQNKNFQSLSVAQFAIFHPEYGVLKNNPQLFREKTNGFALRALLLYLEYCFQNKINIVLDLTLLEPEIDLFIFQTAKKMGYQIQMHLLAVPKKVSDRFISLRALKTGRIVYKTSSAYFFKALPKCFKFLSCQSFWEKNDCLYLWNHLKTCPLYQGKINNPYILFLLNKYWGKSFLKQKKASFIAKGKKAQFPKILANLF